MIFIEGRFDTGPFCLCETPPDTRGSSSFRASLPRTLDTGAAGRDPESRRHNHRLVLHCPGWPALRPGSPVPAALAQAGQAFAGMTSGGAPAVSARVLSTRHSGGSG